MTGRSLAAAVAAAFLLVALAPRPAYAQATPLLPPDDPVHAELARLVGWGLVDTLVAGQRPWSVRQATALARQARRNLERVAARPALAATARDLIERVEARLETAWPERDGLAPPGPLGGGRLDAAWTDSPWRSIPPNVVSTTSAEVNPLLARDGGRRLATGTTAALEGHAAARLGTRVALAAGVRTQVERLRAGSHTRGSAPELRVAYGRVLLGNVGVTAGRAPVMWGHGPEGGLLLSTNPPPLLRVEVANEDPVTLPWILGALGPSRHQAMWADLGTRGRSFPHAFVLALRSSFQPHPRLELGVGVLNQQGGEGAPGATVLERVADLLVIPDLFVTDRDFLFSNKLIQVDALVRVPSARGLEMRAEMVLDDFDTARLRSIFWNDAGYAVGVRLTRLDAAGRLALGVVGEHTGVRFYGHNTFRGGVTVDRRILGSELGTNGDGVRARLDWMPAPLDRLALEAAFERRSNDQWHLELDTHPRGFVRTESRPEEDRWRLTGSWERRERAVGGWWIRARAGVERTTSFAFIEGADRTSWLARVIVGWEGS